MQTRLCFIIAREFLGMSAEIALREYLFRLCFDKVTQHLGYFVSLVFILTNTLRVNYFHKQFEEKWWVKFVFISIFIIGSMFIIGRTFYWTSMMDGIINAKIENEINTQSIGDLLSAAELWVIERKFGSIPRFIAYNAEASMIWLRNLVIGYFIVSGLVWGVYKINKKPHEPNKET